MSGSGNNLFRRRLGLALLALMLIGRVADGGRLLAQDDLPEVWPADLPVFMDEGLLPLPAGWLGSDLRVELKAPTMAPLSAPASGRLAEVQVKDGDPVKKGQLLIQIDDKLPRLRLEVAQAARDQAETQLRLAEKLHDLGSRGALDVEMAAAQFRGAEAEVKLAQALVELHQIRAPWDGRVTQLEVRADQHVPEGAPLLELAESGNLEVEFMMPSAWLNRVKIGTEVLVKVDETGRSYPAEVLRLGGKVDPVTQSIRVYGRLNEAAGELLPGMSGSLRLGDGS